MADFSGVWGAGLGLERGARARWLGDEEQVLEGGGLQEAASEASFMVGTLVKSGRGVRVGCGLGGRFRFVENVWGWGGPGKD